MKRIISALITLCLLMACCSAWADDAVSVGKPYANPNMYTVFPADERPGPEENFYLYANYDGFMEAAANSGSFNYSQASKTYQILTEGIGEISRNTEYTDTESQIVRIIYGLATDNEKREQDGLAPLIARVDRIRSVKTTEELTALLQEDGFLIDMPFLFCEFKPAYGDEGRYILSIVKSPILGKLPLPENATLEDMMAGEKPDLEEGRRILMKMNYSREEADRLAGEIARYDDDFFTGELPAWLPEYDPQFYPVVSLAEIRENCPALYALLTAVGLVKEGAETQPVYQITPNDLGMFLKWYTDENLDTLKAMAAICLYKSSLLLLDQEMFRESADYSSKKTAMHMAYDALKQFAEVPLNQAYVTHYCPEEIWRTATELFAETKEAMRNRITVNTWMSEETKQRALEKLDNLTMGQIVPPGGNFDCGPLLSDLQGCVSLMDAAAKSKRFNNRCMMRFAGEEIVRENPYTSGDFRLGVLAVGGQYLPEKNIFCIGAPALSEGMCDYTSRETLLGTLGYHIGHELCHGFDFRGAQFNVDRTGPLFTEEDNAVFTEKAMAVADRLSLIEIGDGLMLQGPQLITEALADLTGLTLMMDLAKQEDSFDYDAFFRAAADFSFDCRPGVDDFKPDSYGRVNPHPPYHVRVNFTLAHFDEFYETYPTVTEGTPMYIAPEDRTLVY